MAKFEHIPTPAVRRLSLYLRQLERFRAADRRTVSSRELGDAVAVSDAQVRKDLAYFGQFGHPGIGYRIAELIDRVRRILGTDKQSNVLIVGVGNLGRALASYRGFAKQGFDLVAAFDDDARKIGTRLTESIRVRSMDDLVKTVAGHQIRFGILCVPATSAQAAAEQMIAAGIRGILNFAPVTLQVDAGVAVSSVDLAVHLEQLSFQLGGGRYGGGKAADV